MYHNLYAFDVSEAIRSGKIVCCTDRMKGDTFYLNGMNAQEYHMFMAEAMRDRTNRFDFYTYEKEEKQDA